MSTEKQDYSLSHQKAALERYAEAKGYSTVAIYEDAGKSGLGIKGRTGLLDLLEHVLTGQAEFSVILVFDVSRWGRFQDMDESAHYEYICRRAGVRVEYCAELFVNDDSPLSSLLKSIKRTMAAEYSRELSAKVFHAQCRFARRGYKQGGSAGYGLRRMLVSNEGAPKGTLQAGQYKGLASDRVVFVLGPPKEIAVVRRIYRLYLKDKLTQTDIAERLNGEGILSDTGNPWNLWKVKSILTNHKYIGSVVFNRKSTKLRQPLLKNPEDAWIIQEDAFEPIISKKMFIEAQLERAERKRSKSPDELIAGLRSIHERHGAVNARLIAQAGLPNPKIYIKHFGSLSAAYILAGLPITRYVMCGLTKQTITAARDAIVEKFVDLIPTAGGAVARAGAGCILINGTLRVHVAVHRCRSDWGRHHWRIPAVRAEVADFYVVGLLDTANAGVAEHYLFPAAAFERSLTTNESRPESLRRFRYDGIEAMLGLKVDPRVGCGAGSDAA